MCLNCLKIKSTSFLKSIAANVNRHVCLELSYITVCIELFLITCCWLSIFVQSGNSWVMALVWCFLHHFSCMIAPNCFSFGTLEILHVFIKNYLAVWITDHLSNAYSYETSTRFAVYLIWKLVYMQWQSINYSYRLVFRFSNIYIMYYFFWQPDLCRGWRKQDQMAYFSNYKREENFIIRKWHQHTHTYTRTHTHVHKPTPTHSHADRYTTHKRTPTPTHPHTHRGRSQKHKIPFSLIHVCFWWITNKPYPHHTHSLSNTFTIRHLQTHTLNLFTRTLSSGCHRLSMFHHTHFIQDVKL